MQLAVDHFFNLPLRVQRRVGSYRIVGEQGGAVFPSSQRRGGRVSGRGGII